jgi:hypothetical protein
MSASMHAAIEAHHADTFTRQQQHLLHAHPQQHPSSMNDEGAETCTAQFATSQVASSGWQDEESIFGAGDVLEGEASLLSGTVTALFCDVAVLNT